MLHERGVDLEDIDIDFITDNIVTGAKEALRFLEQESADWPKVMFSSNQDTIGYTLDKEAINIPVPYLKEMKKIGKPLQEYLQTVYTLPGKEPLQIPYSQWLKLAGREETVHHFQKKGLPQLKVNYTKHDPSRLTEIDMLLCDIEVEARRIVDEICVALNETPLWKDFDDYLAKSYPSKYNQPIEVLLSM